MMSPSFWFLFALCLPPIAAAAAEEGCSGSGSCGNLAISDPFWLPDWTTGRSCGSSHFEITCLNNTPVLPSSKPYSYGFTVLDISYENHTMRVVDQGKLRLLQLPPASKSDDSCNEPIWNTTEKLHRQFRIDPVANLNLIIYNCTNASAAALSDGELVETGMRCGDASEVFVGVEGRNEEASAVEGCVAVVLPVLGGADGDANASDYEQLISSGFVLTWENPARREKAFTKIVLIDASTDQGYEEEGEYYEEEAEENFSHCTAQDYEEDYQKDGPQEDYDN